MIEAVEEMRALLWRVMHDARDLLQELDVQIKERDEVITFLKKETKSKQSANKYRE